MTAPALRIAEMSLADLERAADWAAAEGWNPGLEDAEAFRAADPGGFLMGWLGDEPVCCISVVKHSAVWSFLGFYICRPEFRGQGHGWAIWNAGIDRLKGLTTGLDGVPAQQGNYAKFGFELIHMTTRRLGPVRGRAHAGIAEATPEDLPDLLALDAALCSQDRGRFLTGWFAPAETRRTLILRENGAATGVATVRRCREGAKIGPLYAPDADRAAALLETAAAEMPAEFHAVDAPDPNGPAHALADGLGFDAPFSCARMHLGPAPKRDLGRIFGETCFELG